MDGPSRAEFQAFADRLYEQMDRGFERITTRLDVLNGRVGKGELEGENHRTRLVNLEKEIFRTPKRRHVDHAGEAEEWAASFSKREYALMSLGFAVIMALLKLVEFLGGKLWTVLTSAKG